MSPWISRSCLVVFMLVAAGGAAVTGPLAHYAAEGTTADSAGAHRGVANGPLAFRPGGIGMGFDLPGTAWINVPSFTGGAGLNPQSLSVALWVQEDIQGNSASFVNLRHLGNNSGFTLESVSGGPGRVAWFVHTGTGLISGYDGFGSSLAGCPTGTRFHVVGTFDAASQRMALYRNGRLVDSKITTSANPMTLFGDEVLLMGRNAVNAFTMDGMLDEIRIYDHVLTQAEILALLPAGPGCAADLVCSGVVDGVDLAQFLGLWTGAATYTPCPAPVQADLNGDCRINGLDLAVLLSGWGPCS